MKIVLNLDKRTGNVTDNQNLFVGQVSYSLEDHEIDLFETFKDGFKKGESEKMSKKECDEIWDLYVKAMFPGKKPVDGISERIINAKNPYNKRESIVNEILSKTQIQGECPTYLSKKIPVDDIIKLKKAGYTIEWILRLKEEGLI